MDAVIRFIEEKGLLRRDGAGDGSNAHSGNSDGSSGSGRIYATGGGAFKFAAKFQVGSVRQRTRGHQLLSKVGHMTNKSCSPMNSAVSQRGCTLGPLSWSRPDVIANSNLYLV